MEETFSVRLSPHGGHFTCRAQQTVLDAALAAGYWLPHSCRSGSCGACHLQVLSGSIQGGCETAGAAGSPPWTCQTCKATPTSDLMLEAPSVPQWPGQRVVLTGGKVLAVHRPSSDVAVLQLRVPKSSGFTFRPGQYAQVLLKDGARRCYSMANAPGDDGLIEWHIRRVEGGRFSSVACDGLKAGVMLRIEGPFGTFGLHPGDAPVVLLASGTGYAPMASMLAAHREALAQRRAVLYWGGRTRKDLYALDDMAAWAAQHPGVKLIPVLSAPDPSWAGRSGLVHAAVLADLPDLSAHEVYACGNPLMVEAARAGFVEQAGLRPDRLFADAFVVNG